MRINTLFWMTNDRVRRRLYIISDRGMLNVDNQMQLREIDLRQWSQNLFSTNPTPNAPKTLPLLTPPLARLSNRRRKNIWPYTSKLYTMRNKTKISGCRHLMVRSMDVWIWKKVWNSEYLRWHLLAFRADNCLNQCHDTDVIYNIYKVVLHRIIQLPIKIQFRLSVLMAL